MEKCVSMPLFLVVATALLGVLALAVWLFVSLAKSEIDRDGSF
jgi:hypothetical protein